MKKAVLGLLSLLLAALLFAGNPVAHAAAEAAGASVGAPDEGQFQYRLRYSPEGFMFTAEITGYKGRETYLKTPEKLDMFPVTAIGTGAFKGNKSLVTVSVQEGVTEIGNEAFAQCGALRTVYLPEGLTDIGSLAFAGCSSLERVIIPDSVQTFGWFAFSEGSKVTVHVGRGSAAERYCQENGIKYTNLSIEEVADWEFQDAVLRIVLFLALVAPMLLASMLVRNNSLEIGMMSTSLGLTFLMILIMILQDFKRGDVPVAILFLLLSSAAVWWGLRCFKEGILDQAANPRLQRSR